MFHRSSHSPVYRHSSSRPFALVTYGRGQPLWYHLRPSKSLDKMEDGVSRMSWSSVRPCYITESRCWAQETKLQRICSVTGTYRRLSPTPLCPPHPSQASTSSPFCHRHGLCGPPLHPAKQVNISSGGYIMPYTNSQGTQAHQSK